MKPTTSADTAVTSAAALSPADIEALADSLSDNADALHKRIMAAIRKNASTAGAAISHAEAQELFEQEIALRQQANSLYADATGFAARGAALPVRELLDLAVRARERIRRIDRAKELAGIASALFNAAAAIAALKPEALVPALEDLKEHVQALPDTDAASDTDKLTTPSSGSGHRMET
ncbi:hypothetical protein [Pseudoduganella lutea]|uniref:hypothetical protein n=1 Tax=Pseudoduganella lutea TaxID=321985 RepID=UPI001A939F57|nr:hypothetical protein [Pseudoduganella lutea]